ncbi:hypothetical protein DPMN_099722 [Dreissena polymorpha]|uniref:Uncharacterized protein n=1 Tax=Dreissena polymorpha TaxID=45954 RepID=A0A9D4LEF0_DREPO|nr:hypothetical protein DPMN_099722 [Dreissena polymorpha]
MTQSADLVQLVLNEVHKAHYSQYHTVPTKLSGSAKALKQMVNGESKKADFFGEFPSIILVHLVECPFRTLAVMCTSSRTRQLSNHRAVTIAIYKSIPSQRPRTTVVGIYASKTYGIRSALGIEK